MEKEELAIMPADEDGDVYTDATDDFGQGAFTVTPVEQSVIKKAANGDQEAFEALFMGTYRYVFAAVRKYLKNDQDAYDAIQETYTRVYKGISRLESYPILLSLASPYSRKLCQGYLKA